MSGLDTLVSSLKVYEQFVVSAHFGLGVHSIYVNSFIVFTFIMDEGVIVK